jgi:rubredoxin
MSRTAYGYRKNENKTEINAESFEEISLDLKCPVCSEKASYRRSEGEEV